MLIGKVRAVTRVYRELDAEIRKFKKSIKIDCTRGCCECCLKPDIEATILEFLPAAYISFRTGKAEEILHRINSSASKSACIFYNPFLHEGKCSIYEYRGLICRLFGFSARLNKKMYLI